jgi:hypothetical protein
MRSGKRAFCQQCQHPVTMLDAQLLMQSLISRHGRLLNEVQDLRSTVNNDTENGPLKLAHFGQTNLPTIADVNRRPSFSDQPFLIRKLRERGMRIRLDNANQDLPLHELKAAALLAEGAVMMKPHLDHIRRSYKQGWATINLLLNLNEPADRPKLARLAFELYASGFFEHFRSEFGKNALALGISPSHDVRRFFEGEWLELWLYFQLIKAFQATGTVHSASRSLLIESSTKKELLLDIACLVNERNFFAIAGSTRDHRLDLDRFYELNQHITECGGTFLICDPTCDVIRAAELSAYYELPFLNLDSMLMTLQEFAAPITQLAASPTPEAKKKRIY